MQRKPIRKISIGMSDFKIVPMAANVQLIFFSKKGSDDILVKFMLNEKEVKGSFRERCSTVLSLGRCREVLS